MTPARCKADISRIDGRTPDSLRPLTSRSVTSTTPRARRLITLGKTVVLCAVSVEDRQPPFLRGTTQGWVTAEYSMLPRSTQTRSQRESVAGRIGGRTHEIQRLIGRSLRAVVDLDALGERTFAIDCDVIQADGGTRTASITGAYVALVQAMQKLVENGTYASLPIRCPVAATSVGIVDGVAAARPLLRRGLARRGRLQRRHDRRGQVRRGAGHGRARHLRPRGHERAAGAGGEGHQGLVRRPAQVLARRRSLPVYSSSAGLARPAPPRPVSLLLHGRFRPFRALRYDTSVAGEPRR